MDLTQEDNKANSEKHADKKRTACIICGSEAEFRIRGVAKDCYCKECAEEYFGLDALDKMEW